jgi:thioredoxin-like negative regulator of GroEL
MPKNIRGIKPDIHKRFTLFKVQIGAKNASEALEKLLQHYEKNNQKEAV